MQEFGREEELCTSDNESIVSCEEEDYFPDEGILVAFSLALDKMAPLYGDPTVKAALMAAKPKKYLAIVGGSWDTVQENDGLHLFPIARRLGGKDYMERLGGGEEHDWHRSCYVKLGKSEAIPDNGRKPMDIEPTLPWSDCIVYTTHGIRTELGRLYQSETRHRISTEEEFRRLEEYVEEDREATDTKRRAKFVEANKNESALSNDEITINTPAYEEELTGGNFPKEMEVRLRVILDLWEDVSDVTAVPYPGDFEAEVEELQRCVRKILVWRPYLDQDGEILMLMEPRDRRAFEDQPAPVEEESSPEPTADVPAPSKTSHDASVDGPPDQPNGTVSPSGRRGILRFLCTLVLPFETLARTILRLVRRTIWCWR